MATSGVDLELRKAFQDLQLKKHTTSQKIQMMEAHCQILNRKFRHASLVSEELRSLPEDVKTYTGVGKMFLVSSIEEAQKDLVKERETCQEGLVGIEKNKEYLEKNMLDAENSLREMIAAKQKSK